MAEPRPKMVTRSFCLFLLVLCVGCHEKNAQHSAIYVSKKLDTHTLWRVDSLLYACDSHFVSRVGRMARWGKHILISDFYTARVFVFDSLLRLERIIGRKGKGPGEFAGFPGIIPLPDRVAFADDILMRVSFYAPDFRFTHAVSLPKDYFLYRDGIYVNSSFVFPGHKDSRLIESEDFRKLRPLIALDSACTSVQEFWQWDEVYFSDEPSLWTYTRANVKPRVAVGPRGTFFANQEATWRIAHFGPDRRVLKYFGVRPRAYKTPPTSFDRSSLEKMSQYAGMTTTFLKLACDTTTGFVYLNYVNPNPDIAFQRTMLAGQHYLQVYNRDYDCIIDEPIPGMLGFADGGMVYILSEERPEYIRILVLGVEKR